MSDISSEIAVYLPVFVGGTIWGVAGFSVLLIVLVPVMRRKREASLLKGICAVLVSFVILTLGTAGLYLFLPQMLLAFCVGEMVGFFACWAILACVAMSGR